MTVSFGFSRKTLLLLAALTCTLPVTATLAMDTFMVGPRAMGMGGANVASVDNNSAQYYNPAAFGFFGKTDKDGKRSAADTGNLGRKDWGFDVNGGAGYRLNNEFGTYVDELANIDYDLLSQNGIQTQSDLEDLINLVSDLNGLDDPGNAITADATAGVSLRIGHFGIGGRGYFQAAGMVPMVDQTNLGITTSIGDINTQIAGFSVSGLDGQILYFDAAQQSQLTGVGLTLASIQKLDFVARQQALEPSQAQEITDTLVNLVNSSGTGNSLDNNTTTILLQGLGVGEIPLSYGYAFNDHFSVGANLKLMKGRVYGTEVLVFDNDSGDVLSNADENYMESTTFGIDLGLLARFSKFNFGLIGRNLNSPKFDGFTQTYQLSNGALKTTTVADVTIDPQITLGVAFIPFATLTLEVDYDVTKNETVLKGYDTQNFSAGLEWDAFRFLALRAGTYKNMAEDDIGWVYTAGLGLNFWLIRLDVAGAMAADTVQFDGQDTPKESRFTAQLSMDF